MDQLGIAMFGVAAIWLSQSKSLNAQRYACVLGLLGQPFWLYATWHAAQWGMFSLCFLYTAAWARGFWTHWGSSPRKALTQSPK